MEIIDGAEGVITQRMDIENPGPAGNVMTEQGNAVLYLTFLIGNDIFGIPVGEIREVIEYRKVFKVPRTPCFIKGVINLRGEVVPVIDLNSRFYSLSSVIRPATSVVIIEVADENQKIPIGVMIDSVKAVTEIYESSIEAVPEIGSRLRSDFVHGIGKVDEKFVILLKMNTILDLAELSDPDA